MIHTTVFKGNAFDVRAYGQCTGEVPAPKGWVLATYNTTKVDWQYDCQSGVQRDMLDEVVIELHEQNDCIQLQTFRCTHSLRTFADNPVLVLYLCLTLPGL